MKHRLSLLILIVATFAMTASAYTYYSNVEIGNFKYSQLALGSSSSEENVAYLKGLSSTASTSLTTLDIPGYVTYNGNRYRVTQINQQAFENNTKITTVNFGYGVENINGYVFNGCTSLKYVNLPSSVKEIGQFVFQNCTSLLVVAFAGEKAPKIYDYTFNLSSTSKRASTATYRGMNALKADANWLAAFGASNILRNYSYMVGDFKVYSSTNGCWQYYTIKNGVPYNGNSSNPAVRSSCVLVGATFTDGSNNKISLPQSVSNSDNNAPGGYKFYGVADSAFMNNTAIKEVVNNNTMAYKIGERAFYGCSSLTSADVPVDTIGDYAFYNCSNLATVNFASSLCNLAYLGNFAFGKCGFTAVNIPATTKFIGSAPFYYCSSLKDITVDANNPNFSSYIGTLYDKSQTKLYQIPGDWQPGNQTSDFSENLQSIMAYAGYGCKFTFLYLPYNLKYIGNAAFMNCETLRTIHFPSSISSVASNSFNGCNAINTVYLNLATPPSQDFFPHITDKSKVNLYTPREGYTSYGNSTIWKQYNRMTGVTDHVNCWDFVKNHAYYTVDSESNYNYNGFTGNGTLKIVHLTPGNFSIPSAVAYGGKNYVPTTISPYAGTKSEDDITIYNAPSITLIDQYAFFESKFTNFPFINVETIGDFAFGSSTLELDLGTTSIPLNHLKTIHDGAFYNSAITSFTATTALESIGVFAFGYCKKLHEIFLPHIDGINPISCGEQFFAENASDFKCWVDYRRLNDFINSNADWDHSKIYPHVKLDSKWQSFACVSNIDFSDSDLQAYTVSNYNQSQKLATLSPCNHLKAGTGAVLHGETDKFYRVYYASQGETSPWMVGITNSNQAVNSNSTTSNFRLNATKPQFDKITSSTTIPRGYAYLSLNTSATDGATTILTNLSGDSTVGDVNGDGRVNVSDVSALINMILGITPMDQTAGDVNGDGRVNVSDVSALINIILGIS